ncbi:hypothetical protein QFW96_14610 [Saccharopolyspora sp. TS4A08]|uniref:Uncharacterized protein n=1 Tax=Saccharopolyspora ipomoeae TaxID=3042027 RepID=A0ABT6PPC0_9PSEU|nr:hypothetical protein [Saccharopolyspora sp. TS4A08]MDI2029860.1 hypothetical protein [Saccharopolyspora sp. TS4A08]
MHLDLVYAHKKQFGIGAVAVAALAVLWLTIGIEAAATLAVLGGLVVALGYASLRQEAAQEQAEEARINVTTPGGAPLAPIQPEITHVNHLLHLVLSILTGGLWLIVWILLTINVKSENDRLQLRYRAAMRRYSAELAAYDEKKRSGQ